MIRNYDTNVFEKSNINDLFIISKEYHNATLDDIADIIKTNVHKLHTKENFECIKDFKERKVIHVDLGLCINALIITDWVIIISFR